MKTIEFEGLRTTTSFNFRNKKERSQYWDNLLKESALRFRNEYSRFLHERLHVIFSYTEIFRGFAVLCTILTIIASLNGNEMLLMVNGGLTVLSLILFAGFHFKFKSFAVAVAVTDEIHTIEFVEALQEMVKSEEIAIGDETYRK